KLFPMKIADVGLSIPVSRIFGFVCAATADAPMTLAKTRPMSRRNGLTIGPLASLPAPLWAHRTPAARWRYLTERSELGHIAVILASRAAICVNSCLANLYPLTFS